jgi:RimJ/RimL family protein N-acetyltransferase
LRDVFERVNLKKVLAYTSANNVRSQAVIKRLNMQRAATLDYSETLGEGVWHGLVWMVRRDDSLDLDHSDDRAR